MAQHLMGEGPLHDAAGHLIDPGYATREVRRYDRAAIAADPARIKEWDYYCVLDADFGLALTVADNGYVGFLGVSWMDLRGRSFVNHGAIDEEMFWDSNGEAIVVFSKVEPFIEELRANLGSERYLKNLETLIMRIPDAKELLASRREMMKRWMQARSEMSQSA